MSAAWDHAEVASPLALLVLLALANHADDSGYCWPSVERIAHLSRTSRRTVQRQLVELETAGLVVRDIGTGAGHTNRYRVLPGLVDNMGNKGVTVTPLPEKRASDSPKRASETTKKGDSCGAVNRQETSETRSAQITPVDNPDITPPDEIPDHVNAIRAAVKRGGDR
jgi:DNA-binding transcriptional regulator YhcF (GntR family)